MKLTVIVPLIIIVISVSGAFFSADDSQRWISVVLSMVIASTVFYTLLFRDITLLFVTFFVANHIVQYAFYARVNFIAIFFLFSPLILYIKKPTKSYPLVYAVLAFALYYTLVFVLRPFTLNFNWFLLHLEALAIFTITYFCFWDFSRVRKVLLLHLVVLIAYGLLEMVFTPSGYRIRGPVFSSTAFAVLLVVVWSCWVCMEIFKNPSKYSRIAIVSALATVVMVASGTRMSVFGIAFTLLLILFIRNVANDNGWGIKKVVQFLASALMLFVLFLAIWHILPDDLVIKNNFDMILRGEVDESNFGRLIVWYTALQAFLEYPVWGLGNGNFQQYLQNYFSAFPIESPHFSLIHAHNIFLITLSENGAVGFILLATLVIMAIVGVVKYLRSQNSDMQMYGLPVGLIILFALGLFDSIPLYPATLSWGAWFLAVMFKLPIDSQIDGTNDEIALIQKQC